MSTRARTEILPQLHPNTIAALVGHFTITLSDDGTAAGAVTTEDRGAVYQARNVTWELVRLAVTIRTAEGDVMLADARQRALDKIARVSRVAAAVGDEAFPEQLAFAMRYAKNPATSRRMAVFKAWQHLTSGCTITDHKSGRVTVLSNPSKPALHALAESFFGGKITARTLDDDLAEMKLSGYQKRVRGKPRKAG